MEKARNPRTAENWIFTALLIVCLALTGVIAYKAPAAATAKNSAFKAESAAIEEAVKYLLNLQRLMDSIEMVTAEKGDSVISLGFTIDEAISISFAEKLPMFAVDKMTGEKTRIFTHEAAVRVDLGKNTLNVVIPVGWIYPSPDFFRKSMLALDEPLLSDRG